MTAAEKLAREIARVAELRGRCGQLIPPHAEQVVVLGSTGSFAIDVMSGAIDQACKAIGAGDPVAIEAAGQQLERITL
jgi:hypothetical protein